MPAAPSSIGQWNVGLSGCDLEGLQLMRKSLGSVRGPMVWQPNEEELRRGAPHVVYEIRTFRLAWQHHKSNEFAYTAWFTHCRNLIGFFDARGKDKDLFARHYIDGTAWEDALKRLARPDKYEDWWNVVSRQASHLTFYRVELEDRGFVPDEGLTNHVLGLALQFVQMLPPPRAAWFGGVLI